MQEAGHKLFELNVIDSTRVHVGFAETYDLQKDAKALDALTWRQVDGIITVHVEGAEAALNEAAKSRPGHAEQLNKLHHRK